MEGGEGEEGADLAGPAGGRQAPWWTRNGLIDGFTRIYCWIVVFARLSFGVNSAIWVSG